MLNHLTAFRCLPGADCVAMVAIDCSDPIVFIPFATDSLLAKAPKPHVRKGGTLSGVLASTW